MKFLKSYKVFEDKEDTIFNSMSNFFTRRFKNKDMYDSIIYWVGKIFLYDNFLFITNIELSEELKDVKKIFMIIGDKYFDNHGLYSKEDLMKEYHITQYTWKEFTYKGNLKDVDDLIKFKNHELSNKQLNELKIIIQNFKNKE